MTARRKFPLVEAVEALTENGYKVLTADEWAEVERLKGELAERDEALRKIAALREGWDSADSTVGFDFTDGFWVAVLTAEEALPESLSARESQDHTQECEDHAFIHHAATGGDADCICPPVTRKGNHDDDTE